MLFIRELNCFFEMLCIVDTNKYSIDGLVLTYTMQIGPSYFSPLEPTVVMMVNEVIFHKNSTELIVMIFVSMDSSLSTIQLYLNFTTKPPTTSDNIGSIAGVAGKLSFSILSYAGGCTPHDLPPGRLPDCQTVGYYSCAGNVTFFSCAESIILSKFSRTDDETSA